MGRTELTLFKRRGDGWDVVTLRREDTTGTNYYLIRIVTGFLRFGVMRKVEVREVPLLSSLPDFDFFVYLTADFLAKGFSRPRRQVRTYPVASLNSTARRILNRARRQQQQRQIPLFLEA